MGEICVSIAAKVAEYLVHPIMRPLLYLFDYHRNVTYLNQQLECLHRASAGVERSVEEANRQGDEILPGVEEWVTNARWIIQNRDDFNEDERKGSKMISCFYLRSRYRLSKLAKRQAEEIVLKIREAHEFGGRVSIRPLPPPLLTLINSASFKDYETFQSRESTFNQIMEALTKEDIILIGVWGMGGVGKTTLIKQVAKQAEEDKLFNKVVMALNISPTPNISGIQGKIARMLGLTFDKDEDRADRLRQSLKKHDKILVILDDVWEKLELGEIGIPYGDDHKGCKLLLTSRECRVLDTDMHTQKEFNVRHLNEEEAWSLFKRTTGDCVESPDLRPIAINVVKECEGLPVAIVTIANALKKESAPVWENALEELRRSAPTNIRGVTKNVYSCLELSYQHLESDEVKSLFLLCSLMGEGDISMDRLLQYAIGFNLFQGVYSWEKAGNKLIALVEKLRVSSLLLDNELDEDNRIDGSLFFNDQQAFVRMRDVVRDVARSIASKGPHPFVVKEAVGLQEAVELQEWLQGTDECRKCSRISLICRNMDELAQGLVCPQLELFLLNSSMRLRIPDDFFQDAKQLRVLDLDRVFLVPFPSSLGFLSNLKTLCLDECQLQDISVIGELKRLQVLSLAWSSIEQLPKEMMQLIDLRVLDLRYCYDLRVIPRNVISSLSRLEYLSMKESPHIEWQWEGFNSTREIYNNACLSELKHLWALRTLEVAVSDPSLLPEDDAVFDNLKYLTKYSIEIGGRLSSIGGYKSSRSLVLNGDKSLHMVKKVLLKRSQVVHLMNMNDTEDVVNELYKDGFVELKYLDIWKCLNIRYIVDSSTSPKLEWVPTSNYTFSMLEELELMFLQNLEAVCHGPIPIGSFGNLRILRLWNCKKLKYVFSLPENGRESNFHRLQSLSLGHLTQLINFYSIGSSSSQESVSFFSHKAAFPALKSLDVYSLPNTRALWHNQIPADSFSKMKTLNVSHCNKLLNFFSLSVAKAFVQLKDLCIAYCGKLEAIVADEDEDEDETTPLLLFPKLTSLRLQCLPQLNRFWSRRLTSRWPLLETLEVLYCDKVEILFQEIGVEGELDYHIQQSFFLVQKVAFPALESLNVYSLPNMKALWHGHLPADSFSKLKKLKVSRCNKLLNVFPLYVAKSLVKLEELHIESCALLKEIVEDEDEDEDEDETTPLFLFPNLAFLTVGDLPQLKGLCSRRSMSTFENTKIVFL